VSTADNTRHLSIEARCAWALEQLRLYGARLREDEVVDRLLGELRAFVAASRESMIAAGLVEACRACEEEEGGSCCGCGMEDHYDGVLLLINLLLGVIIEPERRDEQSCPFLGSAGCRLAARDHVCVNYLCVKVSEFLLPSAVAEMRRCQGRELNTLFLLSDHVTALLGRIQTESSIDSRNSARGEKRGLSGLDTHLSEEQ
jgi:hypothetical protein